MLETIFKTTIMQKRFPVTFICKVHRFGVIQFIEKRFLEGIEMILRLTCQAKSSN